MGAQNSQQKLAHSSKSDGKLQMQLETYERLLMMGFEDENTTLKASKLYPQNFDKAIEYIHTHQNNTTDNTSKNKNIYPYELVENKSNSSILLHIPPFKACISISEANKLTLHDKIDHRDSVGRFVFATVVQKHDTNIKIHYIGWDSKFDTWSDFKTETYRFAKAGSISKRPSHRLMNLKTGDFVDINPIHRHPGWKCGEIRKLDQHSGQIQIVYKIHDKNYLYWVHLDNKDEVAPFTSKSITMPSIQNNSETKEDELIKTSTTDLNKVKFVEAKKLEQSDHEAEIVSNFNTHQQNVNKAISSLDNSHEKDKSIPLHTNTNDMKKVKLAINEPEVDNDEKKDNKQSDPDSSNHEHKENKFATKNQPLVHSSTYKVLTAMGINKAICLETVGKHFNSLEDAVLYASQKQVSSPTQISKIKDEQLKQCGAAQITDNTCGQFARINHILSEYQAVIDTKTDVSNMFQIINDKETHYSALQLSKDYHHLIDIHSFVDIFDNLSRKCHYSKAQCDAIRKSYQDNHNSLGLEKTEQYQNQILLDQIHCYFMHPEQKMIETIFVIQSDNVVNNKCKFKSNIKQCYAFKRIKYMLDKYQNWDDSSIKQNDIFFDVFKSDKYTISWLINDYHHLLEFHEQNEAQLNVSIKCDNHCNLVQKHRYSNPVKISSQEENMIENIMDKIHVYMLHSNDRNELSSSRRNDSRNFYKVETHYKDAYNKFITVINDKQNKENKVDLMYSFGFKYYYYKHQKHEPFYVSAKYNSLKDEVIDNGKHFLSLFEFSESMQRAKQYMNVQRYKETSSDKGFEYLCGIKQNSVISIKHLLSIVLYCNFDVMQREFSRSYRRISPLETQQEMIFRHAKMANWGRILWETVHVFGDKVKTYPKLYHGINTTMLFPSAIAQFNGPCSTTPRLTVAAAFAAQGIIVEMKPIDFDSQNMKCFDCKYVSMYAMEEEVFLLDSGFDLYRGNNAFKFEFSNIMDAEDGTSHERYFQAFSIIKSLVEGNPINGLSNSLIIPKPSIEIENFTIKLITDKINEIKNTELNHPAYISALMKQMFHEISKIDINFTFFKDRNHYLFLNDSLACLDASFINLEVVVPFTNAKQFNINGGIHQKLILNHKIMIYVHNYLSKNRRSIMTNNPSLQEIVIWNIDEYNSSLSIISAYSKYYKKFMSINCKLYIRDGGVYRLIIQLLFNMHIPHFVHKNKEYEMKLEEKAATIDEYDAESDDITKSESKKNVNDAKGIKLKSQPEREQYTSSDNEVKLDNHINTNEENNGGEFVCTSNVASKDESIDLEPKTFQHELSETKKQNDFNEPHLSINNIFYHPESKCGFQLKHCDAFNRLNEMLVNYCNWMQRKKRHGFADSINTYLNAQYTNSNLLNDHHHLIYSHSFDDVFETLSIRCDTGMFVDCRCLSKNHRDRTDLVSTNRRRTESYFGYTDSKEVNCQQLMDQIHCYWLHAYHCCFKLTKQEKQQLLKKSKQITKDNDVDMICNHQQTKLMLNIIKDKTKSIRNHRVIERIYGTNKFTSSFQAANTQQKSNHDDKKSTIMKGISMIYKAITTKEINAEKNENRLTYDFGIKYYYHSEFQDEEFYVTQKDASFKEEMLNNSAQPINYVQWNDLCERATDLKNTEHAKLFFSNGYKIEKYYAINQGSPITGSHVISMLIYCNFDTLQNKYSSTYRRIDAESEKSVKQRHATFYHLAKLLWEAVNIYAPTIYQTKLKKVYTGVNQQLLFASTLATIKGPLSTSTEVNVAMNFTANIGLALELKTKDIGMKYFDCVWLSDFNESECFFLDSATNEFGGNRKFEFAKIINSDTGEIYTDHLVCCNIINKMFSAGYDTEPYDFTSIVENKNMSLNDIHKDVIHLIQCQLKIKSKSKKLPLYIRNLFDFYCENVTHVTIRWDLLLSGNHYGFAKGLIWSKGVNFIRLDVLLSLFKNCMKLTIFGAWKLILDDKSVQYLYTYITRNMKSIKLMEIDILNIRSVYNIDHHRQKFEEVNCRTSVKNGDQLSIHL